MSDASASFVRQNVLGMYRRLMRMAGKVRAADVVKFKSQIRLKFRENKREHDPQEIEKMLTSANSTLGYLKMVTPRDTAQKGAGVTRIILGGEAGSGKKAVTNWHGGNMDPDSVRRHYAGLKRAGFKNNFHAKGVF
jgi:hypothetical protein